MSEDDQPKAFVDWIGVTETLCHAATGHVRTVMLLKLDGCLLAIGHSKSQTTGLPVSSLGSAQQVSRFNSDSVTGSLIASIWNDHLEFGGEQDLQSLSLDCENGQISVAKIGKFLLCFVASHKIQPGMLRGKIMTVLHSLQDLQHIYD